MPRFFLRAFAAAVVIGIAAPALADDPRVPETGAEQGEFVLHALPGEDIHHPGGPPTLTAPTGLVPQTGSQRGVNTPNSLPGKTQPVGEAQPHADVLSPRGVLPRTGAEQGPQTPNSR